MGGADSESKPLPPKLGVGGPFMDEDWPCSRGGSKRGQASRKAKDPY